MQEVDSTEITCADDGSFVLNRALWRGKLVEVFIFVNKDAPSDDLGKFAVSFWFEREDEPRDEMRNRIRNTLEGPVLSLLQLSQTTTLPAVVPVKIQTDWPSAPSYASFIPQSTESIFFISVFDSGSAGAYLVKTQSIDAPFAVLKILLETDALLYTDEKLFSFRARLMAMYRELRILQMIPPHPYIISAPIGLVTVPRADGASVCGFLTTFHPGGNLRSALDDPIEKEGPSLERRVRWAVQIASAVYHLHRVAHTYHGDIKLDNIVLSAKDDAVFIDFEQARHARECLAPEAHGGWDIVSDVSAIGSNDGDQAVAIHYVPYAGPQRDDTWAKHPKAIEAIEVYALGAALKELFEGTFIPDRIGIITEQCMHENPFARPQLDEITVQLNKVFSAV